MPLLDRSSGRKHTTSARTHTGPPYLVACRELLLLRQQARNFFVARRECGLHLVRARLRQLEPARGVHDVLGGRLREHRQLPRRALVGGHRREAVVQLAA